jgi:hypothetical protein
MSQLIVPGRLGNRSSSLGQRKHPYLGLGAYPCSHSSQYHPALSILRTKIIEALASPDPSIPEFALLQVRFVPMASPQFLIRFSLTLAFDLIVVDSPLGSLP